MGFLLTFFPDENAPSPKKCMRRRFSDMSDWMEELATIGVETEVKTERWLELAELQ